MAKKHWNNKSGFALPLVLLIFFVSFILATSVFVFTYSQMRHEVDYGKDMEAIHLAEAGLHYALEYLNNSDPDKVPNDIQGFVSCFYDDGLLIEGVIYQIDDNSITGDIAGHYVLKIVANGTGFTVHSTGWPESADAENNNKRTVVANINKKGFTDYLYFFNSNNSVQDDFYISGPYHSNGDLLVEGSPIFSDIVTYAGEFEIGEALPDFQFGPPRKISGIDFPSSREVMDNLESLAEEYVYYGDTRVFLRGSFMDVSRKKLSGDGDGDGDVDGNSDGDGDGWVTITSVPIPVNGVIFVNGDVYISGETGNGLTIAASGSIIISPVNPIENDDLEIAVEWIRCTNPVSILGLIAGNQISTMTNWYDGNSIPMNSDGIKIEAAIFTFENGFHNDEVQTFIGSVTQNRNELLSAGFTNPAFTYQHSSLIPLYFVEPQNTRFEIISWIETNNHVSFP